MLTDRALSKLKWRCRRGMLENDIFIQRFFLRYQSHITQEEEGALYALMDLSDNDLMDLLLSRKNLQEINFSNNLGQASQVNFTWVEDILQKLKEK